MEIWTWQRGVERGRRRRRRRGDRAFQVERMDGTGQGVKEGIEDEEGIDRTGHKGQTTIRHGRSNALFCEQKENHPPSSV